MQKTLSKIQGGQRLDKPLRLDKRTKKPLVFFLFFWLPFHHATRQAKKQKGKAFKQSIIGLAAMTANYPPNGKTPNRGQSNG